MLPHQSVKVLATFQPPIPGLQYFDIGCRTLSGRLFRLEGKCDGLQPEVTLSHNVIKVCRCFQWHAGVAWPGPGWHVQCACDLRWATGAPPLRLPGANGMVVISLVWPNPSVAGCVLCLQFPATACEDSSSASLIIRNSSTDGSRLFEFGVPQGSFLKVCGQVGVAHIGYIIHILSHAVTTCRTGAGR